MRERWNTEVRGRSVVETFDAVDRDSNVVAQHQQVGCWGNDSRHYRKPVGHRCAVVSGAVTETVTEAEVSSHRQHDQKRYFDEARSSPKTPGNAAHFLNGANPAAFAAVTKANVGLTTADDTSDATKNAAAVTLTNKTLTSPVINTPTGIVKGDVGLGNVDNTC